jgi:hypothetical protein
MTANTPEPEASSSSVPAQPTPSAKPATNADTATQPAVKPAATTTAPAAGKGQPAKGQPAAKAVTPVPPARKVPPRGSGSGGGGLAAAVAVASLLVAVGAIAIAVYALDVAREAKSQAAIAASANRPAANPPAPTATVAPSPTAAATTPTPTAPAFTAELSGAVLRIPPAESLCASVYVDVDTLQTGVYAGHEFYVSRCQGQHVVRIDRKDGAVPTGPNPTPETCAAQLNGAASAPEIVLDVRAGLTFCILTSKVDAQQQGIPQRMAIVEVRAVGSDQSLATLISTYRVPV